MHKTLASIEENVSRLDSDQKSKISKQSPISLVQCHEEDISDLKLENKRLQQDVCELQKQLLYMETYLRRENVKFVGLLSGRAR